jgi:hypothetical protein
MRRSPSFSMSAEIGTDLQAQHGGNTGQIGRVGDFAGPGEDRERPSAGIGASGLMEVGNP